MATSSQAAPATASVAFGVTSNAIGETIVGTHVMKIEGFSGTKDLGVGKSIKSSTFNVGGHGWYIECYPCGDVEESAGWVSLFLCLSVHNEQVEAECLFTLMDGHDGALVEYQDDYRRTNTYNVETSWRWGADLIERADLESFLKDDRFQIRGDVYIVKEFPAVPPPDLHRPLGDLLASGMPGVLTLQVGGELFTVHRGLQGPSAHVAASTTSGAASTAGSHVLTIDGYSNMLGRPGTSIETNWFHVGGHHWDMKLYPSGQNDCLAVSISQPEYEAVKPESLPLLGDSFHVKCDITVVNEITPLRPPDLHRHFGDLLASRVGSDVEFEVGGDLFWAHKLVLATRSTAFMAEFFGPAGKGSSSTVTRVQIDDMEPRVFKALLHFIYTDALPEVHEEDKIAVAQGLLVAADRYAMERLKLICADMLCSYINDACTAITTLDLADKHGCPRLREACKKLLMDLFAKVTP